jgi:hypothetical protein
MNSGEHMIKLMAAAALVSLLAGCSAMPPGQNDSSPCAASPAGYECQIERYRKAN